MSSSRRIKSGWGGQVLKAKLIKMLINKQGIEFQQEWFTRWFLGSTHQHMKLLSHCMPFKLKNMGAIYQRSELRISMDKVEYISKSIIKLTSIRELIASCGMRRIKLFWRNWKSLKGLLIAEVCEVFWRSNWELQKFKKYLCTPANLLTEATSSIENFEGFWRSGLVNLCFGIIK